MFAILKKFCHIAGLICVLSLPACQISSLSEAFQLLGQLDPEGNEICDANLQLCFRSEKGAVETPTPVYVKLVPSLGNTLGSIFEVSLPIKTAKRPITISLGAPDSETATAYQIVYWEDQQWKPLSSSPNAKNSMLQGTFNFATRWALIWKHDVQALCRVGDKKECTVLAKVSGPCAIGFNVCENGMWSKTCVGTIKPQPERCDGKGIDEDCDGVIDGGCQCTDKETKPCGLFVGACRKGLKTCLNGIWSLCEGEIKPVAELCNGKDDDCDGKIDGLSPRPCYSGPKKTEGVSHCQKGIQACVDGLWESCKGERLPRTELCNFQDDDCDGEVDEDFPNVGSSCSEANGVCVNRGTYVCNPDGTGTTCGALRPDAPTSELCNAFDDDCDGQVDEGLSCDYCPNLVPMRGALDDSLDFIKPTSDGHLIIAGHFEDALRLDAKTVLLPKHSKAAVIMHRTIGGKILWKMLIENADVGQLKLANQHIYISGSTFGDAVFGRFAIKQDALKQYVAKINMQGRVLWVHRIATTKESIPSMSIAKNGNVYFVQIADGIGKAKWVNPTAPENPVTFRVVAFSGLGNMVWSHTGTIKDFDDTFSTEGKVFSAIHPKTQELVFGIGLRGINKKLYQNYNATELYKIHDTNQTLVKFGKKSGVVKMMKFGEDGHLYLTMYQKYDSLALSPDLRKNEGYIVTKTSTTSGSFEDLEVSYTYYVPSFGETRKRYPVLYQSTLTSDGWIHILGHNVTSDYKGFGRFRSTKPLGFYRAVIDANTMEMVALRQLTVPSQMGSIQYRMLAVDTRGQLHIVGAYEGSIQWGVSTATSKEHDSVFVCDVALPACRGHLSGCAGKCVDLKTDNQHCGACGHRCKSDEFCKAGQCAPKNCLNGETLCGATCHVLSSSNQHCGACHNACKNGFSCRKGQCIEQCGPSTTLCGTTCHDLNSSSKHCGQCDHVCQSGYQCRQGQCELHCKVGTTVCGTTCADLQTDKLHCGGCNKACKQDEACVLGGCLLDCSGMGKTKCNGQCFDTQSERYHCGGCGIVCKPMEICAKGKCL
tara:strand:- start:16679 stop:19822 length:3144 start_codon:yes stop_codon:yes gene_type:complete